MTLEEISQLTEEDVIFPDGVSFEDYIQQLISEEQSRLDELARIEALNIRFGNITNLGIARDAICPENANLKKLKNDIISSNNTSLLEQLEAADLQIQAEIAVNLPLKNREKEYTKIDKLLLEAIAEKEMGNSAKMEEYKILRQAIKDKYPK